MAASYVIWLLLPSYGWLVVFAAVLGIAYGVRIALVAPVLIELFGTSRLGGLLGTFFTATGIAGLAAPTAANLAVDRLICFDRAVYLNRASSLYGQVGGLSVELEWQCARDGLAYSLTL
jgi:MFS family permease